MAKRFTDTLIWEKEWFMKLPVKHKCLFRFLTERCDPAGVWEPNWTLATIYIGEKCDASDLMLLNDQIEKLPNGKIWLTGFINFQYGKLSEKSPAHIPVFKSIEKNNLKDRVYNRVSNTLMEKEKEMEEDKEEEVKGVQGENYITVDDEKIFDVMPILEFNQVTLNGNQSAHKLRSWRDVVPEWFECHLQVAFNDHKHVVNSFKKYYIDRGKPPNGKPNGQPVKKFKTIDDLSR